MESKSFTAKLETLHSMLLWIRKQLAAGSLSQRELMKIELAAEEALVNIIRYAYKDKPGKINLNVKCSSEGSLEIIIRDKGPYFNPLLHYPKTDFESPLEEREIGGLGISLMCSLMDSVDYQRERQENILILKKSSCAEGSY